ncbi:unnamed protein product [Pseudo-nitzschia multistriata]|uniref:CNNM transmembrane domain-containing protein n=1 Tax=Pseudo-nitzschia multistriata TaxID=183589 RepID=A0A448Z5N6_9STRA|nr:unnamed protein product [Pseudo-nitzschia multistriata]
MGGVGGLLLFPLASLASSTTVGVRDATFSDCIRTALSIGDKSLVLPASFTNPSTESDPRLPFLYASPIAVVYAPYRSSMSLGMDFLDTSAARGDGIVGVWSMAASASVHEGNLQELGNTGRCPRVRKRVVGAVVQGPRGSRRKQRPRFRGCAPATRVSFASQNAAVPSRLHRSQAVPRRNNEGAHNVDHLGSDEEAEPKGQGKRKCLHGCFSNACFDFDAAGDSGKDPVFDYSSIIDTHEPKVFQRTVVNINSILGFEAPDCWIDPRNEIGDKEKETNASNRTEQIRTQRNERKRNAVEDLRMKSLGTTTSISSTAVLFLTVSLLIGNDGGVTGFFVEKDGLLSTPPSTRIATAAFRSKPHPQLRDPISFPATRATIASCRAAPATYGPRYSSHQRLRRPTLAHRHHPETAVAESTSSANRRFSRARDRLRGILARGKKKTQGVRSVMASRKPRIDSGLHPGAPRSSRRRWLALASMAASLAARPTVALAMGAMGGGSSGVSRAPLAKNEQLSLFGLFFGLFAGLALLHAAEIAITTLYPWKVKEFAEEEEKLGKRGTFKILNEDITRVLTTILVASTTCSIFATTVFTHLVAGVFGNSGEKYGALALTALTLFFVELLPKSIGVTNAESVARIMVPPINIMTMFVAPIGVSLSWLSKKTLSILGFKGKESSGITDSQLRLIVTGARDSGTIDHGEQEMIQGVLGLQNQRVKEIMKPRVEIIAVPKDMSVASVLGVVRESGYSRIPVYDGEIDNIVGIVLAKNVLDFFVNGVLVDEDVVKKIRGEEASNNSNSNSIQSQKENLLVTKDGEPVSSSSSSSPLPSTVEKLSSPQLYASQDMPTVQTPKGKENYVKPLTGFELARRMEKSISEAELIENCYFVPETANGWSVLQEMRRRRVHMAIVVDEYGGTEGLVSLEDIVEEVVGEIYDEDDEEEFDFSEDSITLQDDGSFVIRGDADLGDCDTILNLNLDEDEALKVFATLSGFLCMCAGEIPQVGDFVMSRGWCFEIMNADDKKILNVKVDRLVGAYEEGFEETEEDDNPIRGLFKRNVANDGDEIDEDTENDNGEHPSIALNREMAREVERMVDSGNEKRLQLESELDEKQS